MPDYTIYICEFATCCQINTGDCEHAQAHMLELYGRDIDYVMDECILYDCLIAKDEYGVSSSCKCIPIKEINCYEKTRACFLCEETPCAYPHCKGYTVA